MPTNKKRIGYLPRPSVYKIINEIAIEENLSQSKTIGILVEEALNARGLINNRKAKLINKENNLVNKSPFYEDINEMISDEGITYETKVVNNNEDSETRREYNEYKQFLHLKRLLRDNLL